MPIVQAVLTHKVLNKPKMVLDKFREVLKLLGVLNQITAHPELSKKLLMSDDKLKNLYLHSHGTYGH